MSDSGKTLGQTYHEAVEALKAEGMTNADAIRQVAAEHGKNANAIRGSLHQYRARLDGGGSTARRGRSAPSVDDLVSEARAALERALGLIDREVADAKTALDAAQFRYDEAAASVKGRKAEVEKKLAALV